MYGKVFASMFSGSMMGAGSHVQIVMTYAIANADEKGFVELNPVLLSAMIGDPQERIREAIDYLCRPDPNSRTPDEEGRRLVREGQFLYRLVNYGKYREIRDKEARREQNREAKRRQRARERDVSNVSNVSNGQHMSAMSAQAEAEAEAEETKHIPVTEGGPQEGTKEDFCFSSALFVACRQILCPSGSPNPKNNVWSMLRNVCQWASQDKAREDKALALLQQAPEKGKHPIKWWIDQLKRMGYVPPSSKPGYKSTFRGADPQQIGKILTQVVQSQAKKGTTI